MMITRLDDELASLQSLWSLIAIAAFVATLLVVQRASDPARYRWLLFFACAAAAEEAVLARITTRSRDRLELEEGKPVYARVKAVSLS